MEQHGAQSITTIQTLLELQRDWSRKETYNGTIGIVSEYFGAYGMGCDYAFTHLHKQPQRAKYPHKVTKKAKAA